MLLFKKLYFFFNLILTTAFLLCLGILGHQRLLNADLASKTDNKFNAENLLFLAIIFTLIQITLASFYGFKSLNIYKKMDRIIDLTRSKSYTIGDYLTRLGKLGKKINLLIYELNILNKMRASKVSSMHKINLLLLESIESRVIVSDLHGLIYGTTKNVNVLFDLEKSQKNISGKNLINFISDAPWQEIIAEMNQTKEIATRKDLKWEVENTSVISDSSFYPIFDFDNNLTFIICFIDKESIINKLSAKTQQIAQVKQHLFRKIGKFFKK